MNRQPPTAIFFFFNDTATTEIYTLSLHDALPISTHTTWTDTTTASYLYPQKFLEDEAGDHRENEEQPDPVYLDDRSEEHTSELQSLRHLVCRLLLEKKTIMPSMTTNLLQFKTFRH